MKILLLLSILGMASGTFFFMEIQRFYTYDTSYLIICLVLYSLSVCISGDAMADIRDDIRRRKVKKELDAERAFRKLGGE